MHCDLGYIDLEQKTLQPLDNPFGTRLLPMSREHSATYVSGTDNRFNGRSGGIRTHDPQSPRLMRYQAALRSDRRGRPSSVAAGPQSRQQGP